ncbi:MAG: hypothetical protein Q9208_005287 [Pyrenodesmia sp. 3 TL-2023]
MFPLSQLSCLILALSNVVTALPTINPNGLDPSLGRRAALPAQPCGYNEMWPYGVDHSNQPDCTAAATQMCGLIPSQGWKVNEWTQIDVNSCRAMVYHTDQMPAPTVDDCMQTFANIIAACIVQLPGKNDNGSANRNEKDLSNVTKDPSVTVYQIGSATYYQKKLEVNMA